MKKKKEEKRYKFQVVCTVGHKEGFSEPFSSAIVKRVKDKDVYIENKSRNSFCLASFLPGLIRMNVKQGDEVILCSNTCSPGKLKKLANFIAKG